MKVGAFLSVLFCIVDQTGLSNAFQSTWSLPGGVICATEDKKAVRFKDHALWVLPSANIGVDLVDPVSNQAITDSADWSVCFVIASIQFPLKPESCFDLKSAQHAELKFLPYGEHFVIAWGQRGGRACTGSETVRRIHVVPILPSQPSLSQPCRRNEREENHNLKREPGDLAVVVLVNRGQKSLYHAVSSWEASGLLGVASRRVIFLQELQESEYLASHTDARDARVATLPTSSNFEVIGRQTQVGIGPAVNSLVSLVQHAEHVLFLEEDFVVESSLTAEQVHALLEEARTLVRSGQVDVVKLRHRRFPGRPFFPEVWKTHENELFTRKTPYISNHSLLETMHWLHDPPSYFFGSEATDIIWPCNPSGRKLDWFCTFSTHAGWSNNPWLATPSFFMRHIAPVADVDWTKTVEGAINNSPHLWDDQCFVIAQGHGIFTHRDVDGRPTEQQSPFEDPFSVEIQHRIHLVESIKALQQQDRQCPS